MKSLLLLLAATTMAAWVSCSPGVECREQSDCRGLLICVDCDAGSRCCTWLLAVDAGAD